ncbi:18342_t:CDS:2, partial [Gigaspora margarita]
MEYNIHSNNDSINEDILSVLKDLDDTFFVDYSDSEDEEFNTVLDDELISDNDIPDIPLNKLNEFNFCSCRSKQSCFEKIGYKRFLACRAEFESLEKNIRNMVIKGQLLAFQGNKNTDR